MSSGDAFELAWQTVLAPMKLIFIILVVFLSVIIIYLIGSHEEIINYEKVELEEVKTVVLRCVTKDSIVMEEKLNSEFISNCLGMDKYGVRLEFKDKTIIVNEVVYSSYEGFCDKVASCGDLKFKDLNGDILKIKVVFFKKDE